MIIICLCLTGCTDFLARSAFVPEYSATSSVETVVSPATLLPENEQSSAQTDLLQNNPTLAISLASTTVISPTATPTPSKLFPSTSFLPEIAHMPLIGDQLVYTVTLPITVTYSTIDPLTAAPPPAITVAATHLPILEYHYSEYNVENRVMMTTSWFESQMGWLAENGFTTLSAADLISYMNGATFPQKSVILSFDLGTAQKENFVNVIVPTLKKYKFTALFFLLVNDNVITDDCNQSEKFCWDDLRHWQQEGIASIESHGITHADYDTLTIDQMGRDAGQAYQIITVEIGTSPLGFAYPYDSIPGQAPQVIQSLGYQFAVGGNSRPDRCVDVRDGARYSLPRVYPYSNMSIYPIIGGSKGKTFDQMLTSYVTGS